MQDVGGLGPATPEADTPLTLNVFLSYRRDDASAYALLLYQSLSDHNGHNVFMDIETLAPGMDFVDAINDTLGRCDILLALVGRGWLTASDAEGNPRLENPEDFVRLEIEAALARNIRVVPVLVGGALMPRRNQLPGDLARLARRHAFELSDTRWRTDVAALIKAIEHVPESPPAKPLEPESPVTTSASESAGGVEVEAASLTEVPVADAPEATKLLIEQPEPALVEEPAVPLTETTPVEEVSQSPHETVDESAVAQESYAGVDLLGVSAEERLPEEWERTEQPPLEERDGTNGQRVDLDTASPKRLEPSQSEPKIKDLPLRNAILPISTVNVPSAISEPIDHERTEPSVEQGTGEVGTNASRGEVIAKNPVATDSTVVPLSESQIAEPPVKPKTAAGSEMTQQTTEVGDVPSHEVPVRPRRTWRKYCIAGAATLILISVIVAVMASTTPSSPSSPMAWSQPSSIDRGLVMTGVSCASESFCGAIDQLGRNAVIFEGSKWSQPIPLGLTPVLGAGVVAGGISCPSSSFCAAVLGNVYSTFNGSKWSQSQGAFNSAGYLVISCTSASFCMAVDNTGNDYLTFNGSKWSQPLSTGVGNGQISAISCPTASFCAAVSFTGDAQTFKGSTWSKPVLIIPKPNSSGLGLIGISCTSASFCVAADGDNANTVTFSGGTWSKPVSIDAKNHAALDAISCASRSFCVAATGGSALYFDGKSWSHPFSVEPNQLNQISCPSPSFCMAVDSRGNAIAGHATT